MVMEEFFMRFSKAFIVCSLATLSIGAFAQQASVLRDGGSTVGVVYDYRGLQAREASSGQLSGKRQFNPVRFKFTPESNPIFLQEMAADWAQLGIQGAAPTIRKRTAHQGDFQAQTPQANVTFTSPGYRSVTFPAMDGASKDPAYMTASMDVNDFTFDGLSDVSKAEKQLIKNQKLWVPHNFKLEIDGITVGDVHMRPFTVAAADVDGDGFDDVLTSTNLKFVVPMSDAPQYIAWFNNIQKGVDDTRDCRYTIFMTDGSPCCTIHIRCRPIEMGAVDLLGSLTNGGGGPFVVEMKTGTVKFFNNAKGFG
jgi:hypothetical protein